MLNVPNPNIKHKTSHNVDELKHEIRRAFWPGKNHKYFKKRELHMEY